MSCSMCMWMKCQERPEASYPLQLKFWKLEATQDGFWQSDLSPLQKWDKILTVELSA